jgi:pilus assembly protein Flp/PilA
MMQLQGSRMTHLVHIFHVFPHVWHAFIAEKRAVAAMEYGLIAAIVAVSIITGLTKVGTTLEATFASIASKI